MVIDEKGRLFGKISIVDILVVLVMIGLIAGVYFKFFVIDKDHNAANYDTIEYKLLIRAVRQQSVDAMEVGADIYDVKTDSYMGKIGNPSM
jgi:hypothetical protein